MRRKDLLNDPSEQLTAWLDAAQDRGIVLHDAMALATATADGRPSVRMVLFRGLRDGELLFYTNYQSRKAPELDANPRAAVVFWWAELGRQTRVEGRVHRTSREESEAYFCERPRGRRLGAWASAQSAVITNRDALQESYRKYEVRFKDGRIPCPPHWGGYRLVPEVFEFWEEGAHRLHDRFRYTLADTGWLIERLGP